MAMSTKVGNFAFYSRILVLLMQMLFNLVIPDHDAKVFSPPSVHRKLPLDSTADMLFGGFRRWDAIYFHHIAEHGYTYENTLVFFPLFPVTVRLVANTLLYPLQYVVNYSHTLAIAAFLVNFVIFVKSANVLYELSFHILRDEKLAYKAAQLYCINPASIFFSAFYSETLFAFLTFKGMFNLEKGRTLTGSLLFGLSALTRSNGLVNAGFVLHRKFLESVRTVKNLKNADFVEWKTMFVATATSLYLLVSSLIVQVVLCVTPFIIFQYFAYTIFCNRDATYKDIKPHILNYGNKEGYKMAHTGLSPWCHSSVPYSYAYVQANHWDVGFMSYWHVKQIPNFLLALPIILLSVSAILNFVYNNFRVCVTLGVSTPKNIYQYKKTDKEEPRLTAGFHRRELFVYVAELSFLLLFGVFFMHIQVLTRYLCSSSPVIYWFIAHVTTPTDKQNVFSNFRQQKPTNTDDIAGNSTQCDESFQQGSRPIDHGTKSDSKIETLNKLEEEPASGTDKAHTKNAESLLQGSQMDNQGGIRMEVGDGSKHEGFLWGSQLDNQEGIQSGDDLHPDGSVMGSAELTGDLSMNDLDDLYDWDSNNWLYRSIFIYMHLYFFVGIAAFSNFLPWT